MRIPDILGWEANEARQELQSSGWEVETEVTVSPRFSADSECQRVIRVRILRPGCLGLILTPVEISSCRTWIQGLER